MVRPLVFLWVANFGIPNRLKTFVKDWKIIGSICPRVTIILYFLNFWKFLQKYIVFRWIRFGLRFLGTLFIITNIMKNDSNFGVKNALSLIASSWGLRSFLIGIWIISLFLTILKKNLNLGFIVRTWVRLFLSAFFRELERNIILYFQMSLHNFGSHWASRVIFNILF